MKYTGKQFIGIIVIALAIIAVSVFLPMYEVMGGTFNFSSELSFIDVAKFVTSNPISDSFKLFPVLFTCAAFIPAVLLLIFGVCRSKVFSIISALLGLGCLGYSVFAFSQQATSSALYWGDMACISVWTWLVCLLFLIALVVGFAIKKKN